MLISKLTHGIVTDSCTENTTRLIQVLVEEAKYYIIKIHTSRNGVVPLDHTLYLTEETVEMLRETLNSLREDPERYEYKYEKETKDA